MAQEELNRLARDIINNNIYLTLATTNGKTPWSAPLFYCTDVKSNFYFISQMDSLHTRQILKNPKVAFSVFDSRAKEGQGVGVQASGKAYLLNKEKAIKEALNYYSTIFMKCVPESFAAPNPYRLFKIVPDKIYVLDPEAKVDKRVEVEL